MKPIYRIYTKVNYADTSRDPSDIHIEELGVTDNLEKAKQFSNDYIKNHFFRKNTELSEMTNGDFFAFDFCSWGKLLVIEKMKEL